MKYIPGSSPPNECVQNLDNIRGQVYFPNPSLRLWRLQTAIPETLPHAQSAILEVTGLQSQRFPDSQTTSCGQRIQHSELAIGPGRKRVLGITAILVSRHLKTTEHLSETRPTPRTENLVASAVQWADRIMKKIDRSLSDRPQ